MKKILSIMLAAMLVLALLAGCGSKDTTTTTAQPDGTTASENKEVSGTVSTDGSTSMENVIGVLSEP